MGNNTRVCEDKSSKDHTIIKVDPEASSIKRTARSNLVFNTTKRNVSDYYTVVRMLGEGSMGSVACVRKKYNAVGGSAYTVKKKNWFGGKSIVRKSIPMDVLYDSYYKLYALKSIILSRVSNDLIGELRNEIRILQSLDHPNIVKAYEVYESKVNLYVVLQHCSGGNLYTRVPYSEKDSANIVSKLVSAVAYMHAHNICHRDIRFENIMFESKADDAEIKLIDFGLSKVYNPEQKYTNPSSIDAMAPQVLRGVLTSPADNWSIGVVTFMLLSSTKPFFGKKCKNVVVKIVEGEYRFHSQVWKTLSQESKDFVSALLQVDSKKRMTARAALSHPWLKNQSILSDRLPTKETIESVNESIQNYASTGEFKKMALMVIAHQSSTRDISELRKVFAAYDTANDGTIRYEEFYQALKNVNSKYTDGDIEELFKSVDTGNDDKIYYLEFLAATLEARGRIAEERLADAFDRIDSDDSGAISRENLKELLGGEYSDEKINAFLDEVDVDGDGSISFEEFLRCFQEDKRKQIRKIRPDVVESAV